MGTIVGMVDFDVIVVFVVGIAYNLCNADDDSHVCPLDVTIANFHHDDAMELELVLVDDSRLVNGI